MNDYIDFFSNKEVIEMYLSILYKEVRVLKREEILASLPAFKRDYFKER